MVAHPLSTIHFIVTLLGLALIVSGGLELWDYGREAGSGTVWPLALSGLQILLGLAVVLVPGLLTFVPLFVAVALLASAIHDVLRGLWVKEKSAAYFFSGGASGIFGALVMAWPDISILVVALIFGVWMILTGLRLLVSIAPFSKKIGADHQDRKSLPFAILSFVVALVLVVAGSRLTGPPEPDYFYTAPSDIPSTPGELLRSEPFTRAMPTGAKAWRILFSTTLQDGSPAVASGLVIVPKDGVASDTIAWAHGTTGVATGCAPTLQSDPLASGAMPNVEEVLAKGWGIVASDYVGLGVAGHHAYLVGEEAANSVLDAVRASRQIEGAEFGEEVVVWGHSQGGGVTLWTGSTAPDYAPELNIKGVAALAPASDLTTMMKDLEGQQAETLIGPLLLYGMSAAYPDVIVTDYIEPQAKPIYDEVVGRCWTSKAFIVNVLDVAVNKQSPWATSPLDGALGNRVAQNIPFYPIPAPLLVAQGGADTLVLPEMQTAYVQELCAAGQPVDFRIYEGKDHLSVVQDGSPLLGELMQWTEARLAGSEAENTC